MHKVHCVEVSAHIQRPSRICEYTWIIESWNALSAQPNESNRRYTTKHKCGNTPYQNNTFTVSKNCRAISAFAAGLCPFRAKAAEPTPGSWDGHWGLFNGLLACNLSFPSCSQCLVSLQYLSYGFSRWPRCNPQMQTDIYMKVDKGGRII